MLEKFSGKILRKFQENFMRNSLEEFRTFFEYVISIGIPEIILRGISGKITGGILGKCLAKFLEEFLNGETLGEILVEIPG